jgi:hypothetical protein
MYLLGPQPSELARKAKKLAMAKQIVLTAEL